MPSHASNNRYTGDTVYIALGGVAVDTDYRSFGVSESLDLVESTAGSDTAKTYIPTTDDANFTLEVADQIGSGGSALRVKMALGFAGTLLYGPEGTAAGKPKYECLIIVNSVEMPQTYNDLAMRTIGLQRNGDWSAHYEQSGSTF